MKNTRWLVMAVAALMLGGCAQSQTTGNKTAQGIQTLEEGDYAQAQQLFAQAVKDGEDAVPAYRGLGLACMGLGQYSEAESALTSALEETDEKMSENRQDIRLYLSTVQYRLGEYDKTVDTCTDILEEEPKGVADAYFLRGAAYLGEDSQEEAKDDFDQAIQLEPQDYDLYLNIYEAYRQKNLSGIGGEYLNRALNIQGEETEDYYNRGRIYYYLENYEEAQAQLVGPAEQKYEPAMSLMGRVCLAKEDYTRAQDIYQQIQQEFGENTESYNGLALCAIQNEQYDEALTLIGQGLALEGTTGKQELYFNEIVAYEKKLDFAAAKAKAEEYVAMYPTDEDGQKEWTFLSSR